VVSVETVVFLDVMRGLVRSSCQFSPADARYHFETAVFLDVMRGLVRSSCHFSPADARYHFSPTQPNLK
jgi:hypothetical protein